eukprot:3495222-Rhodomonas_salina.4
MPDMVAGRKASPGSPSLSYPTDICDGSGVGGLTCTTCCFRAPLLSAPRLSPCTASQTLPGRYPTIPNRPHVSTGHAVAGA